MNKILSLALKNLTRQKRRNVVLAAAIAFGFFVVTSIDGFTSGVVANLEEQITQLVGGTVLIQGIEKTKSAETGKDKLVSIVRDKNYIHDIVQDLNIDYQSISSYSNSSGQLIFEGRKSILACFGRDFSDKYFLDSLQIIDGSIENFDDPRILVISDKTAESMNLQVGDSALFVTSTIYGQNTVEDFTIAAIMKSNSFVNTMQVYTPIETLNKLIDIPEGGYSTFTIQLKNRKQQNKVANLIEKRIRDDGYNVTSRMDAMLSNPGNIGRGVDKQLKKDEYQWEGTKYAVESLYDELPAIKTVMNIVHIVATVILIVILFIVMVGVSNTYRMVLYERIREIGTMRALGMSGKDTGVVFTTEAVILCIIGAVAGFILSGIAMTIVHFIPVSNEALVLFLHNGHFTFKVSVVTVIIQYILLILLTSWAVHGSAKKSAALSPAEALRTIK